MEVLLQTLDFTVDVRRLAMTFFGREDQMFCQAIYGDTSCGHLGEAAIILQPRKELHHHLFNSSISWAPLDWLAVRPAWCVR